MTIIRFNTGVWAQRLFILLVSILLVSCQTLQPNSIKLPGTRWTLQLLDGHGLLVNTAITLKFDADQMYGSGGCNSYGTGYMLQPDGGFKVGEGTYTLMGCQPEGIGQQEKEYFGILFKTIRYKVENETLFLSNEQGKALQYQRLPKFNVNPNDLVGKTWQLTSAAGLAGTDLQAFTLRFDGRRFKGTTNCREYKGDYQTSNDSLSVTSTEMGTDVSCTEKDQIAEGTYTSLLSEVWQYNVSQTQLELYTDKNEKLVFKLVSQK